MFFFKLRFPGFAFHLIFYETALPTNHKTDSHSIRKCESIEKNHESVFNKLVIIIILIKKSVYLFIVAASGVFNHSNH